MPAHLSKRPAKTGVSLFWLPLALLLAGVCVDAAAQADARAGAEEETEANPENRSDGTPPEGSRTNSRDKYRRVIEEALREFTNGDWYEAMMLFRKAHTLFPNARTLRGMGLAAFENRQYVESIRWLSEALEHPVRPLTKKMKSDIQPIVKRAMRYVGAYALELSPADATVEVDGRSAFIADGRLIVAAGEHRLAVSAEGFRPLTRRLMVQVGDNGELSVELVPAKPPPPAPAATRAVPKKKAVRKMAAGVHDEAHGPLVPWLLVGAGTALATAGGILLGIMQDKKAFLEDPPRPITRGEFDEGQELIRLTSVLGFGLAGAGLVAAGVGIVLLASDTESGTSTDTDREVQLNIGSSGLSLAGSF